MTAALGDTYPVLAYLAEHPEAQSIEIAQALGKADRGRFTASVTNVLCAKGLVAQREVFIPGKGTRWLYSLTAKGAHLLDERGGVMASAPTQREAVDVATLRAMQAAAMPERTVRRRGVRIEGLESKVERVAGQLGWAYYHTFDSRRSKEGFPDLILIRNDRGGIAVELKRQKAEPTAAQNNWLVLFALAGFRTFVWRPLDLLEGRIHEALA